jgi:hypothetical protein
VARLDTAQLLLPTYVTTALSRQDIEIRRIGGLSGRKIANGKLIEVQTEKEKTVIEIA